MANKLNYRRHPVIVTDATGQGPDHPDMQVPQLVDGEGADALPSAYEFWTVENAPTATDPAVLVFDYGVPVKVAGLAHFFYVPGSRDQRRQDWLSGPSAFDEVKISASEDGKEWRERAHLTDLPARCPQLLKIQHPVAARYLRLEVLSMAAGSGPARSYEIETYVDSAPRSLKMRRKIVRRGFPSKLVLPPAERSPRGELKLSADGALIHFKLPAPGLITAATGALEIRVNDEPVHWAVIDAGMFTGWAAGEALDFVASFKRAGLLLKFFRHGTVAYPAPKLEVRARLDSTAKEWCVPEYFYSNANAPREPVVISSATAPTAVSIIGDGETVLTLVPDTDRSWVGVEAEAATASFPLGPEQPQVLVLASKGDWFSGFERAVVDVFNFGEPRQFSPVSQAVPDLCRFLMESRFWSDKHQMLRSFPDVDFFYIFYSLPYAIPALTYWERLSGDDSVARRVDAIVSFTLDRRIRSGPMKGAIFSEYADKQVATRGEIPYEHPPYYAWHVNYPDELLLGMDQGLNRWITAHTMGAVLWSITHLWRCRGRLSDEVVQGARDVADWMVRNQNDDGSWSYAYDEAGEIVSPMSDSGTIWNVWSLWRFSKLTGDAKYSEAAARAIAYFKRTFTANHLYRGYWEDVYGHGKTTLDSAQGYESSIAALAFAEIGDLEAMRMSSQDSLRYVCTRVLECRDRWTSYGGASEQRGWAPGTYIAPTIGYAAHVAWQRTGDDIFRRFSGLAKTIGWWQDSCGGSFWIVAGMTQQPIEMFREKGGRRQFWAIWDSAQKVAYVVPWLVAEIARMSSGRIRLSPESLEGTDDRDGAVAARIFEGTVASTSGQVNWLGLRSTAPGPHPEYQLVLLNHAEATEVTVTSPFGKPPTARIFGSTGRTQDVAFTVAGERISLRMPRRRMVILAWSDAE